MSSTDLSNLATLKFSKEYGILIMVNSLFFGREVNEKGKPFERMGHL